MNVYSIPSMYVYMCLSFSLFSIYQVQYIFLTYTMSYCMVRFNWPQHFNYILSDTEVYQLTWSSLKCEVQHIIVVALCYVLCTPTYIVSLTLSMSFLDIKSS